MEKDFIIKDNRAKYQRMAYQGQNEGRKAWRGNQSQFFRPNSIQRRNKTESKQERAEIEQMKEEFIKKNGVTKCPPHNSKDFEVMDSIYKDSILDGWVSPY